MGIFDFFKKKENAKTKKVFYDNGSIKEEFQVNADGVNHGFSKLYYPNQQLKVQVNWTNGIQDDGEVISYHDNGFGCMPMNIKTNILHIQKMI